MLGDVIDRGPEGFQILLDMASRPNVVGLMGNHEAMAIDAISSLMRCAVRHGARGRSGAEEAVELWFSNGGEVSLNGLLCLEEVEMQTAWDYLRAMSLYRETEAGGRRFLLLHGGLGNFSPLRPLEDYSPEEILWCRPTPDMVYYSDKYVVLGHTPTQMMYASAGERISHGKIFRTNSFIDIDCGCVFSGGRLGCLCLDTMEEIYV